MKHLFDAIKVNSGLTDLNIGVHEKSFGLISIKAMSDALIQNKTLKNLDMNWCGKFTVEVAKLLAEGLKKNVGLASLNLKGSPHDKDAVKIITDAQKQNAALANLQLKI